MEDNSPDGRGTDHSASDLDLSLPGETNGGWSRQRLAQVTTAFIVLGIFLRIVRYLLNFPFRSDESMLAANFLDRGYLDLLQPLGYRQVGPLLFLWAELWAVRVLGFSVLSLRLFPLISAVASVPLFRHVAGRVLEGMPLLLAVAIFAVSGWPIRFGAEVKPYASDLLVALGLLAMAVEWWRRPGRVGWLWALAASAPVALALSFPAVLVAGGVSLGLLGAVWRSGRRTTWVAYAAFNASVAATFLALLASYSASQEDRAYFLNYWAAAFPPLDNLGRLGIWLLKAHTGSLFAYPEGGERQGSVVTTLCVVAAIVALWKRRKTTVLVLCLAPFGLGLVAAAQRRYPYSQSIRTMQYLAPAICILAGLGMSTLLSSLRGPKARRPALIGVLGTLAALGIVRMGIDLVHPYPNATDDRTRAFARWFWFEMERTAEVACIKTDLGKVFRAAHWDDATDMYLCYMKIYSPRHHRGEPLRLDAVSATRPLRCVLFNEVPRKVPGFASWLEEMAMRYDLLRVERYPVSGVDHKPLVHYDCLYFVYEFVPKPSGPAIGALHQPETAQNDSIQRVSERGRPR